MSYLIQKSYRIEKPILYNPCGVNTLYGVILDPALINYISGFKQVYEGSFLTDKREILARTTTLSPYASGETEVFVHNPFPFKVGDVLYEIGDETEDRIAEINAINNASRLFGTITAIDTSSVKQVTWVTPEDTVADDVVSLSIDGLSVSYVAMSDQIDEVVKGLYDALVGGLHSHHSVLEALDISEDGSKLILTLKEPGGVFVTKGSVTGTGSLTIAVQEAIGKMTITPAAGNSSFNVGAKIGRIDQFPVGVIAHRYYLNDEDGMDRATSLSAYDTANVYKKSLPYLDGQIVSLIPTLKFTPTYGEYVPPAVNIP